MMDGDDPILGSDLVGDGTPGPARQSVEGVTRLRERILDVLAELLDSKNLDAYEAADRILLLTLGDSGGPREAWQDWRLAAATINLLPDPLRKYIHDLETRCDPAGDVQRIASLEEQVGALVALRAELGRAGTEPSEDDIRPVFREGFEAAFYESPTEPHQPHIDRAEEIAWLHSKARTRAAAPAAERREPAP